MKKTIENKIKMYVNTKNVFDKHFESFAKSNGFKSRYETFVQELENIQKKSLLQASISHGSAHKNKLVIQNVVDCAVYCASGLISLALELGDRELLERNIYAKDEWLNAPLLKRIGKLNILRRDVIRNQARLEKYNVLEIHIETLKNLIIDHAMLLNSPRIAMMEERASIDKLGEAMFSIDVLLNGELDKMIESNGGLSETIKMEYTQARKLNINENRKRLPGEAPPTDGEDSLGF